MRSQIYTTTATGMHLRKLTASRTYDSFGPSYSPRGRRIVFARSYRSRQSDLWTMNADGSHKRRLTSTGVGEAAPAWSPNGKEIAFAITGPAGANGGIWVMGADGRHRRQLTSGCRCDADPAWSPDGTEIAFDHYDRSTQISNIFVVPADGGAPTELSSDTTDPGVSDRAPAWSPHGSRILFVSDRPDTFGSELWEMQTDGSDGRRVTNTNGRDEADPAWSPDGRRIVYTRSEPAQRPALRQRSERGQPPQDHACVRRVLGLRRCPELAAPALGLRGGRGDLGRRVRVLRGEVLGEHLRELAGLPVVRLGIRPRRARVEQRLVDARLRAPAPRSRKRDPSGTRPRPARPRAPRRAARAWPGSASGGPRRTGPPVQPVLISQTVAPCCVELLARAASRRRSAAAARTARRSRSRTSAAARSRRARCRRASTCSRRGRRRAPARG